MDTLTVNVKEIKNGHVVEKMEFKGDDPFLQLYKFLAKKYGFNGDNK